MKGLRWLLALAASLLVGIDVHAQGVLVASPYAGGVVSVGGATVVRGRHFSLTLGGVYNYGYLLTAPVIAYPVVPPPIVRQVTVVYGVPTLVPPPPVADMASFMDLVARQRDARDGAPGAPTQPRSPMPEERKAPPERVPAPQQVPEAPRRQEPPPPKPAEPPPPIPERKRPEPTPAAEFARHIVEGKDAFAVKSYGLALQHFRRAASIKPQDELGYVLQVEALFALGKYREAVEMIHATLLLKPSWPSTLFHPRDLYEAAADYEERIKTLEQTLAARANDPVLLFLYAYQLWFDGRKDEARPVFERALPLVQDKSGIERFLQAMP